MVKARRELDRDTHPTVVDRHHLVVHAAVVGDLRGVDDDPVTQRVQRRVMRVGDGTRRRRGRREARRAGLDDMFWREVNGTGEHHLAASP